MRLGAASELLSHPKTNVQLPHSKEVEGSIPRPWVCMFCVCVSADGCLSLCGPVMSWSLLECHLPSPRGGTKTSAKTGLFTCSPKSMRNCTHTHTLYIFNATPALERLQLNALLQNAKKLEVL